jgi:hypothetical protein
MMVLLWALLPERAPPALSYTKRSIFRPVGHDFMLATKSAMLATKLLNQWQKVSAAEIAVHIKAGHVVRKRRL